jgi:hypothetical protein
LPKKVLEKKTAHKGNFESKATRKREIVSLIARRLTMPTSKFLSATEVPPPSSADLAALKG